MTRTNENALDALAVQAIALLPDAAASREDIARQLLKMRKLFQDAFALGRAGAGPKSPEPARPVEALRLSPRTVNCLRNCHILTLEDLLMRSEEDLQSTPLLGAQEIAEIRKMLDLRSLRLPKADKVRVFESMEFVEKLTALPTNVVYELDGAALDTHFPANCLTGEVLRNLSAMFALSYRRTLRSAKDYLKRHGSDL